MLHLKEIVSLSVTLPALNVHTNRHLLATLNFRKSFNLLKAAHPTILLNL